MTKNTRWGIVGTILILAAGGAAVTLWRPTEPPVPPTPAPTAWTPEQADQCGQQIMALVQQTDTPDMIQAESLGRAAYELGRAIDALDAGLLDRAARDRIAADLQASCNRWPKEWRNDIDAAIRRLSAK